MKRYNLHTTVTRTEDPWEFKMKSRTDSVMEEDPEGYWVPWPEVVALREQLESQLPEKRIEKLEKALGLVNEGRCPECGEKTRGYKAPFGSFAPEAWATLREMNIDPSTGHRQGCKLSKP